MALVVRKFSTLAVSLAVTTSLLSLGALTPLDHALAGGVKSPPPRSGEGMAYDAARGQVVLFGGGVSCCSGDFFNDTWTWDGHAWTLQHPATSPSARYLMGMAYDELRQEVVMFGGRDANGRPTDTWIWDGTNWIQQHPATSPPGRDSMGMVYDAARGNVVMFGGYEGCYHCDYNDTWIWDGGNWAQLSPPTSPSARDGMGMAYDAARSEVVMFGGTVYFPKTTKQTWTWDGVTWHKRSPLNYPPNGAAMRMAYDPTRSAVLMFDDGKTWSWDGQTWTQLSPISQPGSRGNVGLVLDGPRAKILLMGGAITGDIPLGDTWTWDGTTWSIPFKAKVHLSPNSGPPGTLVKLKGSAFAAIEQVTVTFVDSVNGETVLGTFATDTSGKLAAQVTVPANATNGVQKFRAVGLASQQKGTAKFTVT